MPTEVSDDTALGASIEALGMVERMRYLMDSDLDEYDMASLARELNRQLNIDQANFEQAWSVMGSKERGAWKRLLVHRRPGG